MNSETKIVKAIKKFFDSQNWKYEFFEEESLFESAVQLRENTGAMIHIVAGAEAFTVMIAPEMAAQPERYDEIRAFVNEVNARMLMGGLVLDCEEGVLYFRMGQNCIGQEPGEEIVQDAFMYPISFVDEQFETLGALMAGELSAAQALEQVFAQDGE